MSGKDAGPRQATIAVVAAAAGVSKTTVSHVLSGRRPVSDATRRRVTSVIEELSYRPNALARSLTSLQSHSVAVVVHDVTNPFYPALARGVQDAVYRDGFVNLLLDAAGDPARVHEFLGIALDRRVDGIVLASLEIDSADTFEVRRAGVPVVAIGEPLDPDVRSEVDVVTADDRAIARDAVEALVGLGHRRIGLIAGPPDSAPGTLRAQGYRDGCAAAGLRPPKALSVTADWTREGGQRAMRSLLAGRSVPSAVLCANDLMAIGAIDACRAAGREVPGDVAVHGIDDIDAAALVTPALSTVRVPASTIGRRAGELLLERVRKERAEPRRVAVPHDVVRRAST